MSHWLSLLSLSDSAAHSEAIMLKGRAVMFDPGESIVCRQCNCPQLCFLTSSFMVSFLAIAQFYRAFFPPLPVSTFPAAGGCLNEGKMIFKL